MFEGLGIFIDTHPNAPSIHRKFPYVFYMLSDGSTKYKQNADGGPSAVPACHPSAQIVNSDKPIPVVVSYDRRVLKMWIAGEECFSLKTRQLDFDGHLSISAGTGAASSSHRLMSLETFAEPREERELHDEDLHFSLHFILLALMAAGLLLFKFIKFRH